MKNFVCCKHCGKRLIEQQENGRWYFCFGKSKDTLIVPVEIYIYGSIKIKCLRKSCNQWNLLNNHDLEEVKKEQTNGILEPSTISN
jgi:hypothetical protein